MLAFAISAASLNTKKIWPGWLRRKRRLRLFRCRYPLLRLLPPEYRFAIHERCGLLSA